MNSVTDRWCVCDFILAFVSDLCMVRFCAYCYVLGSNVHNVCVLHFCIYICSALSCYIDKGSRDRTKFPSHQSFVPVYWERTNKQTFFFRNINVYFESDFFAMLCVKERWYAIWTDVILTIKRCNSLVHRNDAFAFTLNWCLFWSDFFFFFTEACGWKGKCALFRISF